MTRRLLVILGALALMLAALVPAATAGPAADSDATSKVQKGKYDSYVVVMKADPLLASFDQDRLDTGKANRERNKLRAAQRKAMRDAGVNTRKTVHSYTNAANGFSALITHEEAERIAAQPDVLMVVPDTFRQLTTDNSGDFLGLSSPAGAWAKGFTGEDVIVGVIDSGIWPEHPSFADDGSYSDLGIVLDESLYSACDFGNSAHNPNDVDFECNNKLLGARQVIPTYRALIGAEPFEYDSARDDDGHGTHTASTAAGNAGVQAEIFDIDRGVVSGVAPRARVIAYKGLGALGGFGSDLAAAIDQAVYDGVDVINYSVGGGASLLGPDDIAYLFAADAGVFVATSAGNSGPGGGTIGGPASVPWLTSVGASTQDRTFQGSASSSDGWEFFGASITAGTDELPLVDAADAGDELCNVGALDPTVVDGKIVLCLRGAIARVAKSQAVYEAGGAGMILYNASDAQSEVTDNHFVPSVHINNTDGLVIKGYIAGSSDPVAQINGGEFTRIDAPWMASFSSRGSNSVAEDIIKPDITAPGVNVLAGNSPTPSLGAPGQLFQSISGTSMSSPHVAGLFALLKQAHPDWSPAAAKSALMTTAYQDVMKEDGATPADPFDMGAGHINANKPAKVWGSIFNPGVVYDAGFLDYLGFLCDAAPEAFANPAATCAFLADNGIPTDASDLNLASIGIAELAGSQTVTRTLTNVSNRQQVMRAVVDAPDGYDVKVMPRRLKIKPGESASFTVTISATDSAAIGEWAFGSLTWRNGRIKARSPIAVRAQLFSGPAAVEGSGETGSASFDVTFGYTGDYSAAAHGLESAVVINDNVAQDPDQAFDPTDGFSNAHVFTTSGAAFVRFAIPPEAVPSADHDIDIFLANSAGDIVASSTNGGTDEVIDVVLPPDDTWTLYVHGWQTVDPTADYTLYAWIISATPGGNMSVTSAPASATLGATETITVGWTGATAGEWHLGAVSHADAGGLLGLTLVEVDNR